MEKFVPYEKLSKRRKRELDMQRRGSWGEISPTTRRTPNPKAYKRQKVRKWRDDVGFGPFALFALPSFLSYIKGLHPHT